jgi:thermitase
MKPTDKMNMKSTWIEFAALPLFAGFALGSSFCMGGDGSIRMLKSFSPAAMMATAQGAAVETAANSEAQLEAKLAQSSEPLKRNEVQEGQGSHPGRHVASGLTPWGLLKTDAPEAWRISNGIFEKNRKIIVAVIDTGADTSHPDLKDNIWTNPGESGMDEIGRDKSSNGIDDDGNGFVDDIHGWNFVFDNENVDDDHGHGTHIAGIIGASGAHRLTGVAPNVSLMILKYFDPRKPQQNPLAATIRAIHYAVANGANVINYSGGGVSPSAEEFAALQDASAHGILVVAAAGNEKSNSDHFKYYPADYKLPNIMSVTAINSRTNVLPSSNYGVATVDIAAPGEDILSTLPGGDYGLMTGTSQATAFATGVAVLVMATHPSLIGHPAQVIEHLVATGETSGNLVGKTRTRAVLNAYRAVAMEDGGLSVAGIEASNIDPATQAFVLAK